MALVHSQPQSLLLSEREEKWSPAAQADQARLALDRNIPREIMKIMNVMTSSHLAGQLGPLQLGNIIYLPSIKL